MSALYIEICGSWKHGSKVSSFDKIFLYGFWHAFHTNKQIPWKYVFSIIFGVATGAQWKGDNQIVQIVQKAIQVASWYFYFCIPIQPSIQVY